MVTDWADEVHSYIQMPFITIPETIMTSIQDFESRLDVGQREFEVEKCNFQYLSNYF